MTYTLVVCKPKLPERYIVQQVGLKHQLSQFVHADEVIHLPVFELIPDPVAIERVQSWLSPDSGVSSTQRNRLIVFVSPSVVEMVLTHLHTWPGNVYCAVMGRQSANLAIQMGVPKEKIIAPRGDTQYDTEDSDGLVYLISRQFKRSTCEILVCKGSRGRTEFCTQLAEMAHPVTVLECYERREIEQSDYFLNALLNKPDRAVLWMTSSETIAVLDRQFQHKSPNQWNDFRRKATVLATHARIAAKCMELGYVHVVKIATGIQSVNSWLNTQQH